MMRLIAEPLAPTDRNFPSLAMRLGQASRARCERFGALRLMTAALDFTTGTVQPPSLPRGGRDFGRQGAEGQTPANNPRQASSIARGSAAPAQAAPCSPRSDAPRSDREAPQPSATDRAQAPPAGS